MASRAISVKVATVKVIKSLEDKLEQIQKDYANQEQYETQYQEAFKAWQKQLFEYAVSNVANATNVRTNYRTWNNNLNVDFDITTNGTDFPAEPKREFQQMHQHTYNEMVEEISNAIRILKMTDEETVNATTFKSIAKYL